ncbi:helix-turn-helix domain-containing protein [Olivibacter sitiensis]|uniref:helix-turn-helix domain-containing protein n=1 Tax=Olivibacter sitiensis TaxID=376470 RepID=UPI0003FF0BE3|nr:helix-turn-helix domain-containing protein [Olivibacter sitiensis]
MAFSRRNILYFLCMLFCLLEAIPAQGMQDSLAKYSYRELDNLVDENRYDSTKMSLYLNYYLQKARREKNTGRIAIYYRSFVFYQKEENRLSFIDSALHYAHQTGDKALVGSAYLTKAAVYYSTKDYQKALDHYLKANDYIAQTHDVYNKYRIKNHIGLLKNYLGYYEEAEELFDACVAYFGRDENSYNMHRGYISSLLGLAWSYTKTNRIAESNELLAKALISAEKAGFSELDVHYVLFKQGINDYIFGKHDSAIHKIAQQLPFLYENEDFAWASIGEFYIGKSYWDKGDKGKALAYFTKIDEVFRSRNYTHPDLREGYELLINYYKARNDKDKQIQYMGQLVLVDNVLSQHHKHLLSRIYKEYTTKDLLRAKEELETVIYLEKNKTMLTVTGSVLVLLFAVTGMYHRQQKTKKTARELIQKIKTLQEQSTPGPVTPTLVKEATKKTNVPLKNEVIEQLLGKLNQFEQNKKFLRPNITLEKLANQLGTNQTYLSSTINKHKNQTFSEYLNSLRINYVLDELVNNRDSIFFKYSIEAMAKHVGYNNATAFSRAFQTRTGVKPSVFIKEVTKDDVSLAS